MASKHKNLMGVATSYNKTNKTFINGYNESDYDSDEDTDAPLCDTMNNYTGYPQTKSAPAIKVVDDKDDDYINDPLEKRKMKTTKVVTEILYEIQFVKDVYARKTLFKALTHLIEEFSDIDWNEIAIAGENNSVCTITKLLFVSKYIDIIEYFLKSNLIDPIRKDVNGESLQDLVENVGPHLDQGVVNVINKYIIIRQKEELKNLKSLINK